MPSVTSGFLKMCAAFDKIMTIEGKMMKEDQTNQSFVVGVVNQFFVLII
jgi:hypothetical protein